MRSAPSVRGGKIRRALSKGEVVEVVRNHGKWSYVKTADGSGWAWSGYLRPTRDDAALGESAGSARGMADHLRSAGRSPTARRARPTRSTRDRRDEAAASAASTAAASTAGTAAPSTSGIDRRNLGGLQPGFRAKVERVLARLQARGWRPYVAEGRRTRAQQREKVRRGYSRTMNSRHLSGRAADIVDRRYGWGGPAARQTYRFWRDLGAAARAEGLTWGGNWRTPDVAHVQQ
jgi:hypothetical protein